MSVSSYELSEWRAFERAHGPLGMEYSDSLLAAIHEQQQFGNYINGMGHFGSKKNPAPKPSHYPRPDDVFRPSKEEQDTGMSREDFDSMF